MKLCHGNAFALLILFYFASLNKLFGWFDMFLLSCDISKVLIGSQLYAIHCAIYIYVYIYMYVYIYIYIKWTVLVNVTTKSAQHAHARMIVIIVEKSPNSSHMYDHGFMDNTNRQAVKNWLDSQTSDAYLTSWRKPFCKSKWLPPWRKGRITCLWIVCAPTVLRIWQEAHCHWRNTGRYGI